MYVPIHACVTYLLEVDTFTSFSLCKHTRSNVYAYKSCTRDSPFRSGRLHFLSLCKHTRSNVYALCMYVPIHACVTYFLELDTFTSFSLCKHTRPNVYALCMYAYKSCMRDIPFRSGYLHSLSLCKHTRSNVHALCMYA